MWEKIVLPFITERLVAVSLPIDGKIIILDMENAYMVDLVNCGTTVIDNKYNIVDQYFIVGKKNQIEKKPVMLGFAGQNYTFIGLFGQLGIISENDKKSIILKITPNSAAQSSLVIKECEKLVLNYNFNDLSGDWTVTSFSQDGRFVVLANPYELAVFQNRTD